MATFQQILDDAWSHFTISCDVAFQTWRIEYKRITGNWPESAAPIVPKGTSDIRENYVKTHAAAKEKLYTDLVSRALMELESPNEFKRFVSHMKFWDQGHRIPSFDQLPDKCKHFARLLALEGKWPIV